MENLVGQVFGMLTVIGLGDKRGDKILWKCKCVCGVITQAPGYALKAGRPKGCKSCSQKKRFEGLKTCGGCNKSKNRNEFYKSKPYLCKECLKPILSEKRKARSKRQRLEVLKHYSNGEPACNCCGESHIEFLTIDHINGGGNKHRQSLSDNKEIQGSGGFVRWLLKEGCPAGYRVLCYNCNVSLGIHGYCPHEYRPKIHQGVPSI